jgi:DNA-binding transcriptional LysR family regulator
MDQTARSIEAWKEGEGLRRRIRISAGDWTARLLIDNLSSFWTPDAGWMPEILADLRNRDIARRQIDIGIRNSRPKQAWLAGQKVGRVQYAAYQAASVPKGAEPGWIGLVEDDAHSPTGLWLVRKGNARMLLPTFVGDAFPDLVRIGGPFEGMETERWLVMHQDERHEPTVRQAVSALTKFLKQNPILSSFC